MSLVISVLALRIEHNENDRVAPLLKGWIILAISSNTSNFGF